MRCYAGQVVKTTLEKGYAAGYEKEAQVCVKLAVFRMCLTAALSSH